MKKKLTLLAVLVCMALSLTACSQPTLEDYYETAQLYLGNGDYEDAADLFAQLGEYRDSADYVLYCQALEAIAEEDYVLARTNLSAVSPFKSSERYLTLVQALMLEADGEEEAALALYESLGTFADADYEAERLRKAIPEAAIREGRALMAKGEYEQARELFLSLDGYGQSEVLAKSCTNALNNAAYAAADALLEEGDTLGAMAAFEVLGDTLDAAKRAQECRDAVLEALDAKFADVTLASARALMDEYAALGDDPTALERIAALTSCYGKNLDLIEEAAQADAHPYVLLGRYPGGESGTEHDVLWRVLRTEGTSVTLLCETVLDASPVATATSLTLTEAEQSAVLESTLPAASDLAALSDLSCAATPYALAQGTTQEDGLALYWLRDSLESGLHPVISADGTLTLPGSTVTPGIRPMITVSLEDIVFTLGSGAPDDPFRTN